MSIPDKRLPLPSQPPKRVLFVSYYFPPSGGPGVQRTLKFVKYLSRFGWTPVVLTVDPEAASYPAIDRGLMSEVPDVEVIRTNAWDPYSLYARVLGKPKSATVGVGFIGEGKENKRQALGRWIRGNLFVPDARVGWIPFASRAALRYLKESPVDAIITTGPPHSAHLIGQKLKRILGVPWVADFRDPWTGIDFYESLRMSAYSKRRDRRLELSVFQEADAVVAVTPGMVRSLATKGAAPVSLISNGFDPDDFKEPSGARSIVDLEREAERRPPVLAYVGNMNGARNPEGLWEALARLRKRGVDFGDFRVRLVGPIDGEITRRVQHHNLADIVDIEPPVDHAEAIRIMQQSEMLLLVINRVTGADAILTGKVFEYIGSGRPVLGLGPVGGDAADVLRHSGAGTLFDWDDVEGIEAYVANAFGFGCERIPTSGAPPEGRAAYSRLDQAGQVASLLNQLVVAKDAG